MKLKARLYFTLLALPALSFAIGCNQPAGDGGGGEAETATTNGGGASHGHSHGDADVLFWQREELEHEGYVIALGHHGLHLDAGHELEAAVMVTKDGAPVDSAKVFVSLLDAEGANVVVAETATIYEPPTDEEPAHYAQASLMVPAEGDAATLRYRIEFPDAAEFSLDVPVEVEHHEH